jgi:hypothetical protein
MVQRSCDALAGTGVPMAIIPPVPPTCSPTTSASRRTSVRRWRSLLRGGGDRDTADRLTACAVPGALTVCVPDG